MAAAAPPFPWVFSYQDDPAVGKDLRLGRAVLRPLVEVRLGRSDMSNRVWALIDSGSEYTLASRWLAQAIGAEPDEDRALTLGIGGANVRARFADVRLVFGPPDLPEESWVEWHTEVGFVEHWRASWPILLGQRGFFDQFTVTMSCLSQAVAVSQREDFDDRFPPEDVLSAD